MKRAQKGDPYIFISMRSLEPVSTHDAYFPSDDEKWVDRNYFTDGRTARTISVSLKEEFGSRLEEVRSSIESNRTKFIRSAVKLAKAVKKKMLKKEYNDICSKLREAYETYSKTSKDLSRETSEIKDAIRDHIKLNNI